ncbi:MAG: hypothetical protein K6L76_02935 [Agarilytica sp.]
MLLANGVAVGEGEVVIVGLAKGEIVGVVDGVGVGIGEEPLPELLSAPVEPPPQLTNPIAVIDKNNALIMAASLQFECN